MFLYSFYEYDDWVCLLGPKEMGWNLIATENGPLRVALGRFDMSLGMTTYEAVHRQLRVDLPRSLVCVGGRRTVDPDRVLRYTAFPRLCTQAVFAPIVEWFLYNDYVTHDAGEPLKVQIDASSGDVSLLKRFSLRDWNGNILRDATAHVTSDIRTDSLWIWII